MPRVIHLLLLTIVKTLLLYAVIITGLNFVKFGGEPMIERLVSVKETRGLSFSDIRFKEAFQVSDVDILFLGSSHTLGGFDPRIFARLGYKTMNLGSSSQTPMNTVALLERHLTRLKPKLVVYEVFQVAFGLDGAESFYDIVKNSPTDFPIVKMAWDIRQPQAWTTLLSASLRGPDTIPDKLIREKDGWKVLYINGGYVQNTATITQDDYSKMQADRKKFNYPVDKRQLSHFQKCIQMSRAIGATFTACSYPIPTEARNSLEGYKTKQKELTRFLEMNHVPYKDFNDELKLDTKACYYDEVHLNQAGVERFNPALVDWLRKEELLPRPSIPN